MSQLPFNPSLNQIMLAKKVGLDVKYLDPMLFIEVQRNPILKEKMNRIFELNKAQLSTGPGTKIQGKEPIEKKPINNLNSQFLEENRKAITIGFLFVAVVVAYFWQRSLSS